MPPSVSHTVGLPDGHDLHDIANWLERHFGGSDTVPIPAGEHRNVYGVRFSCPAAGSDCLLTMTRDDETIAVSSTGGMATAVLAPGHAVELPSSSYGLGFWLEQHFRNYPFRGFDPSFIVPAGQYRDAGGVRFSCPPDGADCEVTITTMDGFGFDATSTGGKASAHNKPVKLPNGARDFWAVGDTLTVPAGQYRDAGNVRFSCPPDGADCDVAFVSGYALSGIFDKTCVGGCLAEVSATIEPGAVSLGGAATADFVPLSDPAFFKHANDHDADRIGFPYSGNIGAGAKAAARAAEAATAASRVSGDYPSGSLAPTAHFAGRASGSSADDIQTTVSLFTGAGNGSVREGIVLTPSGRFTGLELSEDGTIYAHVWSHIERAESPTDDNWMAFGYWLRTDNPATTRREDALGVYAAYNKLYPTGTDFVDLKSLTGTAAYNGFAAGVHAKGTSVLPFDAKVILVADFGNGTDAGTLSGEIQDIVSGSEAWPGKISLLGSAIEFSGSGSKVEGSAVAKEDPTATGSELSGGWEARFLGDRPSTGADATKYPGSVAGTFAVTGGRAGTDRQTFLGAFGAYR